MGLMPQEVKDLDLAFGGSAMKLLPKYADIPDEFKKHHGNKWVGVVGDWFFSGLKNAQWKPKAGVDQTMALRHIKACMGSYEPKHEHKIAGCAYLFSEFFDDVTYDKAK